MGLFDIFKNKTIETTNLPSNQVEDINNDIKKETFVDDSEPSQFLDNSINNETFYGTGFPIDVIYDFLKKNYENDGYDDALTSREYSYMKSNEEIIHNRLNILFKQVTQRYKDDISTLQSNIVSNKDFGLVNTVMQLENRLHIYNEHLNELDKMQKDLENEEAYMVLMLKTYERGFKRGLTALSLEELNSHQ